MNVLHVTNMFPDRSRVTFGIFVKRQIEALEREGVNCEVLMVDGNRSLWEYFKSPWRVMRVMKEKHYDIVHFHYGITAFFGWVGVKYRRRTKVVVSYCGSDLLGNPSRHRNFPLKSAVINILSQMAAIVADGLIVKTEEMREKIWLRKDRERCRVLPNGVDFQFFQYVDKDAARRQLGLDPNRVYVLFPSNPYVARKRVELARAAVRALRLSYEEVELLEVYDRKQSELLQYYQACDCVILTSRSEGSPNVVKEAMACSRPVVSVDVGDVSNLFLGAEGCLISNSDVEDLTRNLMKAISYPGETNGRQVIGHLSCQNVARKIRSEVYEKLIMGEMAGGAVGKRI